MLAYIFWHWPLPEIGRERYEDSLVAFHDILAALSPEGFLGSMILRHDGAPWTGGGGDVYEDWYLLDGSAALDALNDAAVSGARRMPHDRVAGLADGGAGGLYFLRMGEVSAAAHAHWFAKPAGVSYAELYETIGRIIAGTGAALWERRMVLGPAPEFCLAADEPMSLPAPFEATRIERFAVRGR